MPKLPVIKSDKLLKLLFKLGFYTHHQTGSHVQLKHPDGRRTTVPYHKGKEIRRGTLKGIITDIQLTVDEFTRVMKK